MICGGLTAPLCRYCGDLRPCHEESLWESFWRCQGDTRWESRWGCQEETLPSLIRLGRVPLDNDIRFGMAICSRRIDVSSKEGLLLLRPKCSTVTDSLWWRSWAVAYFDAFRLGIRGSARDLASQMHHRCGSRNKSEECCDEDRAVLLGRAPLSATAYGSDLTRFPSRAAPLRPDPRTSLCCRCAAARAGQLLTPQRCSRSSGW